MLLIYTPHITNRVKYIFNYVFEERLGIQFMLTDDKDAYLENSAAYKIFYAGENIHHGLYFHAQQLLFESDIKQFQLCEGTSNNIKVIFSHTENAALGFDVFAAVFYLLSRYEEYFDDAKIIHGNYDFHNSILYKLDILHTPIIEQWLEILKEVLLKNFSFIQFKKHKPQVLLSFDIDVAYAYKNRSLVRTAGGLIKKISRFNFNEAKNQALTLINMRKDMFDTYSYIFSSIKNKKAIFFFNMGLYGKFDKNPSWKNRQFQKLLQSISDKTRVGLHPSYASNKNKFLVSSEKNKLEKITGKQINASRQHYLKLQFPATYQALIENNITEDYTIGYYYNYGFRAGTCNPFLFFDLHKNETTALRLFPFTYMDGTLNDVLKLTIGEAKNAVSRLIEEVYKHNGIFIPLWHNSTLCNCDGWKGWREVFEYTLDEIDKKDFSNIE